MEHGREGERTGVGFWRATTTLSLTQPGKNATKNCSHLFLQPSDLFLKSSDPPFVVFAFIRGPPALVPAQTSLVFALFCPCGIQLTFFGIYTIMFGAPADNKIQIVIARTVPPSFLTFPGSRNWGGRARSRAGRRHLVDRTSRGNRFARG